VVSDLDPSLLVESIQVKKDETLAITLRKPIELQDAYMMFLLHLNEDFDDDLLLEAVDLLIDHP
jgi:hypothetical protein